MVQELRYLSECDAFIEDIDTRSGPPAPLTICWNITYECNMRCPHCLAPTSDLQRQDDHLSVLKWLRQWQGLRVVVSGGEPCLRPNLLGEVMSELKAMGHHTILSTNGTYWDAIRPITSYLDWIDVSFTGTSAYIYSQTRPLDAYYLALDSVKRSLASSIRVRLSYTVGDFNFDDAFDFPQFVLRQGVRHARIGRILPTGRGAKFQQFLSTKKLKTLATHLNTFKDQLRIVPPRIGKSLSSFLDGYPVVSPDGHLYAGIVSTERNLGHVSQFRIDQLPLSVKNLFHTNRLLFNKTKLHMRRK